MIVHLKDSDIIQVCLYLLNHTRKEYLTDEIRWFLEENIRETMDEIEDSHYLYINDKKEYKPNEKWWVPVKPIKR